MERESFWRALANYPPEFVSSRVFPPIQLAPKVIGYHNPPWTNRIYDLLYRIADWPSRFFECSIDGSNWDEEVCTVESRLGMWALGRMKVQTPIYEPGWKTVEDRGVIRWVRELDGEVPK